MARPVLGDLPLEQVQLLETQEDQVVTHHPVASLDGGFLQPVGRRAALFDLRGVLTAAPTLDSLADLRERFLAAEPIDFVSDISTATLVGRVLIEQMDVRDVAGTPERIAYRFVLREYEPPEPVTTEPVEVPPTELPPTDHGALSVTVVVADEPTFDLDGAVVTVSGTPDEGPPMGPRQLTERITDDTWFEEEFPAGDYTAQATVDDVDASGAPMQLTGSADVRVDNGAVAEVTIVLRRGARLATVMATHFRFDSAFVEPCMRPVLRDVVARAAAHPDDRLLVVGHTDLAGSDEYNQSLSERRGRSVYAALTFGVDPDRAVREWDELRRPRAAGVLPSSRDTWGLREYQQMLSDLGYYTGALDGDLDLTDAAVRRFQSDNGLTPDGDVGDLTWPVLIRAYLAQDALAIAPDRLLPNRDDAGCDEGALRWLGCSEQDPVRNTADAWRPNRRTEVLFTTDAELPCPVPRPDTLDQVPDGAGGGGWCLDPDGDATAVCCFVTPADEPCSSAATDRWCRQPTDPTTLAVTGRLQRSDGTPVAGATYVLIAPDGEYLDGEVAVTSGGVRAGTPVLGRTDADGRFAYTRETPAGIYTIEVQGPFVVHLLGEQVTTARGPVTCARLSEGDELVVVVVDRGVVGVVPTLTGPDAVVVDRPHTTPARQRLTLAATEPFTGTGRLSRSSDAVRVFDAPVGGTELAFDGSDDTFTGDQLGAGVDLFLVGARASDEVDDVTFTLALEVGGTPGLTATHTLTAVALTLDVALSRPAAGGDPPLLSEAAKIDPGRPLQLQTPTRDAARAMVVVQQPEPAGFAGDLSLDSVAARVAVHDGEVPAAGDAPRTLPLVVPAATIPNTGLQLFVEGTGVSVDPRDAGLALGLAAVEPQGDRIAVTVVGLDLTATATAAAPALTAVQVGLWDDAFDTTTGDLLNDPAPADHFIDRDSRHVHLRVRNAAAADEVRAGWTTEFDDGTTDDDRPGPVFSDEVSLLETAAGTGVFVSRGVMLVTDEDDRDADIDSGMAAGHPDAGDRGFGDSNHRVRQITVDEDHRLVSRTRMTYTVMPGVDPFAVRLPVFERDPEDRRRIRVHLVDVREEPGGSPILGFLREFEVTETIRDIYATAGIYAEVDRIEIDPPASASSWRATYPTDLLAADPAVEISRGVGAFLVPSPSEQDIIDDVTALPDFDDGDLYVVMVRHIWVAPVPVPPATGLQEAAGGEAFIDDDLPAASDARGFVFVAIDSGVTRFADPHEMTHVTTNLDVGTGHFDLQAAGAATAGPIDGKNLMHRFFLTDGAGVADPKRLWDRSFTNTAQGFTIPAQVTAIRGSRFTRPYA